MSPVALQKFFAQENLRHQIMKKNIQKISYPLIKKNNIYCFYCLNRKSPGMHKTDLLSPCHVFGIEMRHVLL